MAKVSSRARLALVVIVFCGILATTVVDAFISPTSPCLAYRVNIPRRSSFHPDVRAGVDLQEESSDTVPVSPPPAKRSRLWSKLLAVVVTTMTGVSLKKLPVPSAVAGHARAFRAAVMSLVTAWALLTLLWRSSSNDSAENDQATSGGESAKVWVNDRLAEAEEVDRQREEREQKEAAAREAERLTQAREWAAATLKTAKEVREQAERERMRKEEERRKAEIWLDSTSRGGLIDLEGDSDDSDDASPPTDDDDDDEETISTRSEAEEDTSSTIDSDERMMLSIKSGDRGAQLWMENAVRRSGADLMGGRRRKGRSAGNRDADSRGDADFDEENPNSSAV